MKGTEKQVAWATEIVENINKCFGEGKKHVHPDAVYLLDDMQDAINNADYAGDIINLFKDIRFRDAEQAFAEVIAVFRITVPATEGERKIIDTWRKVNAK